MAALRPARFAGTWYPADPGRLAGLFDLALRAARSAPHPDPLPGTGRLAGAVLPHAGLAYSAPGQLTALDSSQPLPPRVLILAPSHYYPLDPGQLYTGGFAGYDTPLGILGTWQPDGEGPWNRHRLALEREHAVELLLPVLAWLAPSIEVCAMLVGPVDTSAQLERIGQTLDAALASCGGDCLVLASSDLTHYGVRFGHQPWGPADSSDAAARCLERDHAACTLLADGNCAGFLAAQEKLAPTMCGRHPALVLAWLAARRGWTGAVHDGYRSDQAVAAAPGSWPGSAEGTASERSDGFVSYRAISFREAQHA